MSLPVTFYWEPSDNQCISLRKYVTNADGNNIIFDGKLSNPSSGTGDVGFNGVSRKISITSANDLSGINFTIRGKLNGFNISETISGPDGGTVYTQEDFSIVESITFDDSPDAFVSVGSGHTGFTNWFWFNHYCEFPSTSVQVNKVAGNVTHTVVSTLEDVRVIPESDLGTKFISGTDGATGNQLVNVTEPYMFLRVTFDDGTNDSGEAKVVILQQGVK